MQHDHLTKGEKFALFTTGAGGAFNILLYQLGFSLADATLAQPGLNASTVLFVLRAVFAAISFVGFDLTLVVTVQAMRDGRRSRWAYITVGAALLAAAGIGLDVAGVWTLPYLHAANAVVLAAFMLHLAAPSTDALILMRAERDAAQRQQLHVDALRLEAEDRAAQLTREAESLRADVDAQSGELTRLRDILTQTQRERDAVKRELSQKPEEVIELRNGERVSVRRLAAQLEIPEANLRRRIDAALNVSDE